MVHPKLVDEITRCEAEIARLQDYGLPPTGAKGFITAFMAAKERMALQYADEQKLRARINETVAEPLIAAYRAGGELERQEIRDLLDANPKFARGFGWDHDTAPPPVDTLETLRRGLVLSAMKGTNPDFRDEIVAFETFLKGAKGAGADPVALLLEQAALAGDTPRNGRPSHRALVLEKVEKLRAGGW